MPSELFMYKVRSFFVPTMCRFRIMEITEGGTSSIDCYVCSKLASFLVPTDSFISRFVVTSTSRIHKILRASRLSKIAPRIIESIYVSMIDIFGRPCSCNNRPYDVVNIELLGSYSNSEIYPFSARRFSGILGSSEMPDFDSSGSCNFPPQFPGFRVIRKQLSQFFGGWLSHRNSPGWRNRLARQASGDLRESPDAALSILPAG